MCVICSEQKLRKCDSLLYADNNTVGGLPVLSPRPIVDAALQLEALLNKLEQVVANVMKDIDNKKLVNMIFCYPNYCNHFGMIREGFPPYLWQK